MLVISILFFSLNGLIGQNNLPKKIKISRGVCMKTCGYNYPFDEIRYKGQIEYNIQKKTFRYRKKNKKRFKEICYTNDSILSSLKIYSQLEEIYKDFEKVSLGAGKYYIFKVELIYFDEKIELPTKIEAMEFLHTDIIDDSYPKILLDLVEEYYKIISEKESCR